MSTFTLRRAKIEDAGAIGAVHVASWATAYADLMPAHVIASKPLALRIRQWGEWLENNAANAAREIWVAETVTPTPEVMGFVCGGSTRDACRTHYSGEIYALYLRPEAFGKGMGKALFQQMRQRLMAQGHQDHMVWVMEKNQRARRFYEKQGGLLFASKTIPMGNPPTEIAEVAYGYKQ